MNHHSTMKDRNTSPPSFHSVASLLYLGVIFTMLYENLMTYCRGLSTLWGITLSVALLLFLLLLEQYEQRKADSNTPIYVAIMWLVLRFVLFEVIDLLSCSGFTKFLYFIIPFQVYFVLGHRASIALSGFYVVRLIIEIAYFCLDGCGTGNQVETLLIVALGLVFITSMARVIKDEEASRTRAERLLAELEASHQKLREYSTQVAELAATEERNRLAREIHDSLGHYLTVINVQLEKAIAFRERNPQEANQAVQDAKRSAREALQDVRESVGALRRSNEGFSLSVALNELIEQLGDGKFKIDLQIKGQEIGFSKAVLFMLYRAVQEGLTNVQKHASADQATVHIEFDHVSDQVVLSLQDDGKGFDPQILHQLPAERDNCFGLQGLLERVELVGGHMTVQSHSGDGTHLLITAPKNPLALNGLLTNR